MTLRTFSSGGGVQSSAALVLSAQGRIDYPVHLFANVGDDSEAPNTLSYVHQVLMPFAEKHGVEFHELRRIKRDGSVETLLGRLTRAASRSLPIPVRMGDSGAPGTRTCTVDFKITVLGRWLKAHGATPDDPAHVGIGFSSDEMRRVGRAMKRPREVFEYPLIELGLSRADCQALVREAGLPAAPKSACWFCPMHRPSAWARMRRDDPQHFWQSVDLEDQLNRRRSDLGRDPVYFTRFGKPLDFAISEAQTPLFGDDDEWGAEACDDASCFT